VQKLEEAGGAVIGKTNVDEFGMEFSASSSSLKKTANPWDLTRTPGGACGGSAAAVAAGVVPFALGSDAGGSVRQPAAFCGVVGLKPGYGAVSRHGLAAYASSMESIGVFADTVARCRDVFAVIRGGDPRDQISRDAPEAAPPLFPAGNGTKKIGVLGAEAVVKALETAVKNSNNKEFEAAACACVAED
jgi:aspartyl-tRNA(Asn)/glutamyl-tRNA(Gln) amidotransferase subunit A